MDDLEDIDALMNQAVATAKLERKQKELKQAKKAQEDPKNREVKQIYQNPDNWERTRGIALIHADTQTLLGNYSEYVHKTVPNCRRLLRESTPISVSATESVEGSWWLEDNRRPEPVQEWHTKRQVIIHIHLAALQVHSPACELNVFLSYGSIARVELAVDTQFAQEDGKQVQMLFFPAGTNVLPEMSQDCKIALRVELGQEAA